MTAGIVAAATMLAGQGATPALAATLTVGCTAGDFVTIQAAVTAAGAGDTVRVCAGVYAEYISITDNNLKLLADGDVTIVPPALPSPANGALITVSNASNVTVNGFILDGADLYGTSAGVVGIFFQESSGTASNNTVKRMRHTPLDSTVYAGGGITAGNSSGTPKTIKVLHNTIQDFQASGISIIGPYNVTISRNMILGSATGGSQPAGIRLVDTVGGTISSNTISSDWNPWNTYDSTGIYMESASNVSVSKNDVRATRVGILLMDLCPADPGISDNNLIKSNVLKANAFGVILYAESACASTVTNNRVQANTIFDYSNHGGNGVWIQTFGGLSVVTGNRITGNKIGGYQNGSGPIEDDSMVAVITGNTTTLAPPPGAP